MLDEIHAGYHVAGEITRSGYRLTITAPDGATATAVYPTLISDIEARQFAHRLIAHLAAGFSLHPTRATPPANSRQLPTGDDDELPQP